MPVGSVRHGTVPPREPGRGCYPHHELPEAQAAGDDGHPVCWEGDISEPGFDFRRGCATLPDERHEPTQADRQRAFEQFQTTDDHCMELCGLARDADGHLFFIAKNSWGTDNPYRGFMYLSYNYVRMKTIAIVVRNGEGKGIIVDSNG